MYHNDKNPINLNYHTFITELVDYCKQTAVSLNVIGCWFMIERSSSSNKSFFVDGVDLFLAALKIPDILRRHLKITKGTIEKLKQTDGQNTPD